MKNRDTSAVASFSTSFTFLFTQEDQSTKRSGWLGYNPGFTFSFASEYNATIYAGHLDPGIKYLAVEFDTLTTVLSMKIQLTITSVF